jgi:uncharacterized protein involved in type VI secretion and phage assembly
MYFLPEVDDEVLVGFEGGNLSKPVVLGSLWNPNSLPPTNNSDNLNRKRMIKSKSGHTITLDDTLEMEQVVIKSKGGHTITLDDTPLTGQVQVQFQGGGSITMDAKGGVVIKGQTIELQADTTIKLSATEVDVV